MSVAAKLDISTRRYELNYAKTPRGRGSWAFIVIDGSCNKEVETVFTPSLTYSDAKVWIRAYISENFSEELDTGFLYVEVGT